MLEHAWIIPALPALSFVLILAFGKRLPKGGSEIGIAAVGIAFVLSLVIGVGWIQRVNDAEHGETETEHALVAQEEGETPGAEGGAEPTEDATEGEGEEAAGAEEEHVTEPVVSEVTWLQNGGVEFKIGTLVDGLSTVLLFVVTLVSLLVHVYSTDYVHGDRRYTHFFAFLSLFTASMLFFVLTTNTLQLIVGWELVGLCSFVLIGHWWEEKPNSDAALKAFLTNRVGDVGLLVGVSILFWAADGSFDIIRINALANAGEIRHLLLLVAACSLMAAVMSKSGQFVLHTWLPDAMAGPTPVSALIHAATMVVAGIYMIARMYGVFWNGLSIGISNLNLMAIIGAVTLVFGALLAFVQADIKKVLAYSTVSQLGYMVMALGVGAWTAAIFHLFTHAFFKACLFLSAGSLSHAVHSFDMVKDMGGMRRYMPRTYVTFLIATIALMGIPPLAGFWSKDEILAGAGQLGGEGGYTLMLVMGTIGAFLTCAYMTRVLWLVFFGDPRGAAAQHHPHESGPRIVVPLFILAGLAVVAGLVNLPDTGIFSWVPDSWALRFEHYFEPTAAYFPEIEHPEFSLAVALVSTLVALAGATSAYLWFFRGLGPHGITARNPAARAGYRLLENKYYLDKLYTDIIAGGIKGPIAQASYWFNQHVIDAVVNGAGIASRLAGRFVYDKIDQNVVDGIVNGSGLTAEGSGQILRRQQTGRVQAYGTYLFAGATILAAVFVIASST
jgi:NADH-quinone oxidoreductase subunit L